eukprot:13677841-Ditylum_brightwellii.AAC.1
MESPVLSLYVQPEGNKIVLRIPHDVVLSPYLSRKDQTESFISKVTEKCQHQMIVYFSKM